MRCPHASTKCPPRGALRALLAAAALACAACGLPPGSIGAILAQDQAGSLRVREAPDGLAGARAGLQPGDEIVGIDGADARGLATDEIHRRLSGPVGTPVELTIVRAGSISKLTVVRGPYLQRKKGP